MFDPYRKWLGILPKDQPPNYYRLLGLELFEHDLDVIESAVDRTMGFIRQYQSGEHATEAASLLNEIARARICLLKPASKSEYDAKLKSETGGLQKSVAEQVDPEMDWETVELSAAPRKPVESRRKKSKKNSSLAWPWILGGVTCVLFVIAIKTLSKSSVKTSPDGAASVSETPVATTAVTDKTKSTSMPSEAATTSDLASLPKQPPVLQSASVINLVPHGDMEFPAEKFSTTFPMVTPNGEKITLECSRVNPHSGQACLRIVGVCPWVGVRILKMDIPTGKTIHGKAWRRSDLGGGHFLLTTVKEERVVHKHELWGKNSQEWEEITWMLTPEQLENATQLIVELAAGTEFDVYFDDICIWIE